MTELLKKIRAAPTRVDAIDIIYDEMDELLIAGKIVEAKAELVAAAEGNLQLSFVLSFLTITLPWVVQLGEARVKMEERARAITSDKATLQGLVSPQDTDLFVGFVTDDHEDDLKAAQDRICAAPWYGGCGECCNGAIGTEANPQGETCPKCQGTGRRSVHVIAHESTDQPPFVAHLYMQGEEHPTWAGTVWRDDRWPTIEEMIGALTRWRGKGSPKFTAEWWKEP